jgi:lipopolysaccharide transport system permease protein
MPECIRRNIRGVFHKMSSIGETVREVYRYRALVWALAQRHLATRYRGSLLGFLWSILNPLFLMLVYLLVFHYYMRSSFVEHYPIFLFCGLLPWAWTSSALMEGATSIVSGGHLITKSMFPAQLLPVVSVLTTMVNFILSIPLLILFMFLSGVPLHSTFLLLPVVILLQFLLLVGAGLALSALNVLFRDVQHIVGNLLSLLFFLCPIVYPESVVPAHFKFSLDLNPLALLTQVYHQIILNGALPTLTQALYLGGWTALVLLVGNLIFIRYRESFAELL